MLDDPRLPSIAYVLLDRAQRYAEATVKGSFGLASAEKFWTDRYSHLRSHGYVLRARYTPDWCPSWLGTNLDPTFCEDSIMLKVRAPVSQNPHRLTPVYHIEAQSDRRYTPTRRIPRRY